MSRNHVRMIAKTVFVKNNNVDAAANVLDGILRKDKILDNIRRNRYYEKPYLKRQRLSFERCKRIYNTDMQKKIAFVMRKNREDPWPR
ncbi:hypothetical protein SNE40_003600 [Patella caerulea]|uniref:Mitochondrial ribosomal protein S21 n=1 Tax=Patella caerulea TaxID=87958 RepID=A0AAN8KGT8_PATCE